MNDGRAWLRASAEKYDVIMVDAYQDITIPFQMSTVEFFTIVKDHLKLAGALNDIKEPQLRAMMKCVHNEAEAYAAGDKILTDDKAPVELLGIKVIDKFIGEEIGTVQEIYKKEGLNGLLDLLD